MTTTTPPPSSTSSVNPSRTVVTSFGTTTTSRPPPPTHQNNGIDDDDVYESGVWVLHSCSSHVAGGTGFVGCALTNGDVQVYDTNTLQRKQTYTKCHSSTITDLTCSSNNTTNTFFISSGIQNQQQNQQQSPSIVLYDLRQPTPALSIKHLPNQQEQALSVSLGYDAALIAAVGGSKANVHFYDLRRTGTTTYSPPLGTYHDAHTEEVTTVRFQQQQNTSPFLLSASEDGLCCIFDTSKPSEDAALQTVFNVGSPLRQVGFFGDNNGEGVYCLTGSETLSVWHVPSAQRISTYFEANLRQELGKLLFGTTTTRQVDYLVDCHWDGQELLLLGGCRGLQEQEQQHLAAIFKVDAGALSLRNVLQNGHQGDIRSWSHCGSNTYITVGEDARMCEWNLDASAAITPSSTKSTTTRGGPIRREKTKQTSRPY